MKWMYFTDQIEQFVLSGVVLSIRGAQRQGGDIQYLAGVLAHAEHTCNITMGDWPALLAQVRGALDADQGTLIDAALTKAKQIGP